MPDGPKWGDRDRNGGSGAADGGKGEWMRHQAMVIASQLPADYDEAIEVLKWAKMLVEFMRASQLA